MTALLGLPAPILLLLPLTMAAGAEMYLTLLILGASAWLGGWPLDSSPLDPLGGPVTLIFLGVLYLTEAAAELRPLPALLWHNAQLVLRPLGGFFLGILILTGLGPATVILGALGAALLTALIHVHSWGGGLLLRIRPSGRVSPVTLNLLLDTCALALLVLTLENPGWGFAVAVLILGALLMLGRPLHGVTRFGFGLLWEGIWAF